MFITGITKFSKVGVFSALNNLSDISLEEEFAAICGYTKLEVTIYFANYIEQCQIKLRMTDNEFWEKLKFYYNGYTWDGETAMYNPFSLLNLFKKKKFIPYLMDYMFPMDLCLTMI